MRLLVTSVVALLTAGFAVACDRSAAPTAPSTSAEAAGRVSPAVTQVPFKATFSATGTAVTGDRCPVLTVEIHATGNATHLGRLTDDQSHCAAPPSLAFTDGVFAFTAATGTASGHVLRRIRAAGPAAIHHRWPLHDNGRHGPVRWRDGRR